MTRTPHRLGSKDSVADRIVSVLIDSTRRQYVLTVIAYVTGMLGLATVFAQEFWLSVPDDVAVRVSILLMGLSFLSLLFAALSGPVAREE